MPSARGGVPERPNGTGCKPVASSFGGSNPPAPTRSGCCCKWGPSARPFARWSNPGGSVSANRSEAVAVGHGRSPHTREIDLAIARDGRRMSGAPWVFGGGPGVSAHGLVDSSVRLRLPVTPSQVSVSVSSSRSRSEPAAPGNCGRARRRARAAARARGPGRLPPTLGAAAASPPACMVVEPICAVPASRIVASR